MEIFTYNYYEELLKAFKDNGYEFAFFDNFDLINKKDAKVVILRHDVDFDIQKAKIICDIEKKHNVPSTYFFMLNSKFYNIHNIENYKLIKEIISLGNRLGVHFDETSYEDKKQLNKFILNEIHFFETLFKQKIQVLSFHRPIEKILLDKIQIPIAHTYQKLYSKDIKYISDSRKEMCEGDFLDIVNSKKYKKIQLLIHPFWWNKINRNASLDYEDFIRRKNIELKKEISNNSAIYIFQENDKE